MKEIVKNNIINYELIRIRQNTPVLEYLKKHNFSFRLKHVSHELLEQLKKLIILLIWNMEILLLDMGD